MRVSKEVWSVVLIFIVVKVLIFLIGIVGSNVFDVSDPYYRNAYIFEENGIWDNWDGQWFLKVAEENYTPEPQSDRDLQSRCFFPLYSMLIFIFGFVFGNYISGLIISTIASLVGIIYLYKLVRWDYGDFISKRTVLYLIIFPTALFFSVIYSEALFFMFTIMAFYYARNRAWWLAGIFGLMSSLTRFIGLFIIVPLLIEYFISKSDIKNWKFTWKIDWDILWLLLCPLGVLFYFIYLKLYVGDFFAYFLGQSVWGRGSVLDLFSKVGEVFSNFYIHYPHYSMIDIFVSLVFVVMLYYVFKKTKLSYFVYSAYIVLIPLLSGSFMSMPRMVLVSFPHFIVFAMWGKNKWLNYFFVLLFSVLLGVSVVMFVNHYWVA